VRTGEDTAANRALVRRGYVAFRDPAIRFVHRSPCSTTGELMRHHFKRGRGWGRLLVAEYRETGGLLNRTVLRTRLVEHLPKRLRRINQNVAMADPELADALVDAFPLVVCGAVASWAGQWWELFRPAPGKVDILLGTPVLNLLVGDTSVESRARLVQVDLVNGRVTPKEVPTDLQLRLDAGAAIPLATAWERMLAGSSSQSRLGVGAFREAAGATLDVPDIEIIAGSSADLGQVLPFEGGSNASDSRSATERWLRGMWMIAQGRLRTSLSPFRMYRLIAGVTRSSR
jgi:hypothetical protein